MTNSKISSNLKRFKAPLKVEELKEISKMVVETGKTIVFPTDTVYGIGAHYRDKGSLGTIYQIKNRPKDSPLLNLISKKELLFELADFESNGVTEVAHKLIDNFWPGMLTIIVKANKNTNPNLISPNGTIGIRMPGDPIALAIIEACGGILPTTSANFSGEKSPQTSSEVNKDFLKKCDIFVEEALTPHGEESTIIDITSKPPKILRVGSIKSTDIKKFI